MKNSFIQLYKKVTSLNEKIIQVAKKKLTTHCKKVCVAMKKIYNGSIINAALAKKVTCDVILLY